MALSADLLSRLVQIIIINLVLSGDNAVVIGMAAHPLPRRQRRFAISLGGGAAIVLRLVLTAVAALLLELPAVKAIGGVLLLWIGYKLLEEEEETVEGARAVSNLRDAILTILIADLIMSLDNVLGVAAAANGDVGLLIFGISVSMAIVILGGGIFAELIDRMWWLAYLGTAVIAWTGAELVLEDELVVQSGWLPASAHVAVGLVVTLAVVGLAHYIHRVHHRRPAER